MAPFNPDLGKCILEYIINSSINECELEIKKDAKAFQDKGFTDAELYDYLNKIGKMPVSRFTLHDGKKICVGHISSFVQRLCELDKHYERPVDKIRPQSRIIWTTGE